MHRLWTYLFIVGGLTLSSLPLLAQQQAEFAGMTCVPLNAAQLAEVEKSYGEAAGVLVKAVAPGSLADKTGVKPGDVLMAVRLAAETDYHPIPARFDDFTRFCDKHRPSGTMRLLLLRKQAWAQLKCLLGQPLGTPVPEGVMAGPQPEAVAAGAGGFGFVSTEPGKVVAKALDGSELTQRDVDVYGGLLAWCFGTRLTESQKATVQASMAEFWKAATAPDVQAFAQGVRPMPDLVPKLAVPQREQLRQNFATVFINMMLGQPNHALSRVIQAVSAGARQVLAGAGTDAELTPQDVDSLLEYLCFQTQLNTGQPVPITPEQHTKFTAQTVAYFNRAKPEEKKMLANMDAMWATMRVAWAQAQQAQQQALMQQWQRAYQQQQNPYVTAWQQGAPAGGGGGGEMSDSTFNTMMGVLNRSHEDSMVALSRISDSGGSVYDGAGNWLYSY